MSGPWEKYGSTQRAPAGPWEKYKAPEQDASIGQRALEGIVAAARAVDSYTGAPVRKGIGSIQDGKGITEAASDAWGQVGENPDLAPTGQQIAEKAGLSTERKVIRAAEEQRKFDEMFNPGWAASMKQAGATQKDVEAYSPAEVAGLGIDVAADWTNLIPVGLVGKGISKAAAKAGIGAVSEGAKVTASALKRGEDAAARAGKKVISSHLGPSDESIEYYLKNRERLKDVPSVTTQIEPLKSSIDDAAAPLGEAVRDSEKQLAQSIQAQRDELANLNTQLAREEANLRALKAEKTVSAKEERLMAMDQHRENIRTLSDAVKEQKLRLAEAEKLAAREIAPAVNQAVHRLGEEVSKGSAKSFKILEESGVMVPKRQFTKDLDTVIAALDADAATSKAVALVDSLKTFRQNLSKYPDQIPGAKAKSLIQQLDDEIKYIDGGEKLRGKDGMLQGMRRYIDRQLKVVPEYRKQMVPVAKDTRLLKKARRLGDEQSTINLLGRLGKNSSKVEEDTLRALEARFGYDFRSKLDSRNMAEFKELVRLEEKLKSAKYGPEAKRIAERIKAIEASLSSDADLLAAQRRAAELDESIKRAKDPARINERRAALEARKQEAAPFDKLIKDEHGRTRTQGVINNQLRVNRRTRDIETQRMLSGLDAKYGTNFSQRLEDLRHLAEFEKEFNRGSTNTNLWGIASSALGMLLFGPLGVTMGGIGVLIGKGMDKFGPEVARVILDQAPLIEKMRPSEWVRKLQIPEAAKAQLVENMASVGQITANSARGGHLAGKGLRDAGSGMSKVAEGEQDPNRKPAKGADKWATDGAARLGLDGASAEKLLQSKEGKRLLIEASDLKPGSARLQRIREQIQKGLGAK